jgi:hypothetical protein
LPINVGDAAYDPRAAKHQALVGQARLIVQRKAAQRMTAAISKTFVDADHDGGVQVCSRRPPERSVPGAFG